MSEKTKKDYQEKAETEKKAFGRIQGNPWENWFQAGALIEDEADRVDRCGTCGWELTEEVCIRCNSYYPEFNVGQGEDLGATSTDETGENIRFSGDEDETTRSELSQDDGFIVDDHVIEYDSAEDPLSDHDDLEMESSRQAKRTRVICESDDNE